MKGQRMTVISQRTEMMLERNTVIVLWGLEMGQCFIVLEYLNFVLQQRTMVEHWHILGKVGNSDRRVWHADDSRYHFDGTCDHFY